MATSIPLQDLTIYLANDNLKHADIVSQIKSRNHQSFDIGETRYHLYAKRFLTKPPSWMQFFEGRLKKDMVWDSSAPGIVLLIDIAGRTFATTFGQGRHMLIPGSWEDQFGLKVVLNTVEKVRSLEKRSFDANLSQTKTQTNTYTDVDQFGFDFEQDILRGVTGRPIDAKRFGVKVSGADALNISVAVDLAGLPGLLYSLYKQSKLANYKTNFPFVDHMRAVASPNERDALDKEMISQLSARIEDLKLRRAKSSFPFDVVVPKVIDWGRTTNFGYGQNRRANPERQDISLDTFLEYLGSKRSPLTEDSIRKSVIIGLDASGIQTESWSGYKCLVGEATLSSKKYILSDGSWYQVEKEYLKELDTFVSGIKPYPLKFPFTREVKSLITIRASKLRMQAYIASIRKWFDQQLINRLSFATFTLRTTNSATLFM